MNIISNALLRLWRRGDLRAKLRRLWCFLKKHRITLAANVGRLNSLDASRELVLVRLARLTAVEHLLAWTDHLRGESELLAVEDKSVVRIVKLVLSVVATF